MSKSNTHMLPLYPLKAVFMLLFNYILLITLSHLYANVMINLTMNKLLEMEESHGLSALFYPAPEKCPDRSQM